MTYLAGAISNVPGACGVGNAHGFTIEAGDAPTQRELSTGWEYRWRMPALADNRNTGGTDFIFAGFVNTRACRQAYTLFSSKHKLVYQSPVRTNRNSRRKFFFAIWDTRK